MRFLHVTQRYPPAIGGAERYIADLSEELVKRGHQVDVYTTRALDFHSWENVLSPFEHLNGVDVYRFLTLHRREWVWKVLNFGMRNYWRARSRLYEPFIFFGGGPIAPGMFWAMLHHGRQYDLIHLNCLVYSHVTYGYWAAKWLEVPAVVTPHAHAEQEVTYNVGYQRAVLFGCDHVIADTQAEREMFLSLGVDPWRASVGGTGVHPEHYTLGSQAEARRRLGVPERGTDGGRPFVILFLGRKSDYKGLDVALDAYISLRPQWPDLHFMAVGPETEYSRALWPRYQSTPGLHVFGAVSEDEKVLALRACDCLVLPSVGEAFGIVFLEAWIMGRPVIGARTLALSSVIRDGVDGLLAAPGDAADLAVCIARVASDPELAYAMGARGREKVLRRYVVPSLTDRVEGIYMKTLRRCAREKERA